MTPQKMEISHRTIIFTVLFLLGLAVLWQLRSLIVLFFICFIFMESLNPAVTRLEKFHIPRPLAILLVYVIIISLVSVAFAGIIPGLIEQTSGLATTIPQVLSNFNFFGLSAADISSQLKILETLPQDIARTAFSLFSDILTGFIVLVVTFYMLLEKKNFPKYTFSFFGRHGKEKATLILDEMETKLGHWVNAELFLMSIIGILSYFGYLAIGLRYALPLGIIAGILEAVPNIGPTLASILAGAIGLTVSPLTAVTAIVWGIIVQQLENNFIVPKIMKETVGLNPLVTIFLIATGAKLGGIVGAVLAIPLYLTVEVFVKVLTNKAEK
ncbi:MAG TPA: AI-2E family transporter [Patescibacteria group bacterium]